MAEQPTIVARGEAVREVPPEQAAISATVTARDRDRDAVLTRLTGRAAELRRVLDGYGEAIAKRETGLVQIYPDLKHGSERVVAYTGQVTTAVTVTDFVALGDLLLRLAALDQVAVAGPWWQLRPGSRAGADVRREAIADALARAREYAEAVGARVERLIEISDEMAGGVSPMMAPGFAAAERHADLQLDPQQQTVQASVIVRVAISEPDLAR